MTDLAADVQQLLAREHLRELNLRYSMAIDDRRIDDLVECFAPDGELGHSDAAVHGRADIAAFYRARLAAYGPTYHYPHGSIYEIEGDRATGVVLAHSELAIDGDMYQVAFRYIDSYVRDGRWMIARRELRTLYFAPVAELPRVFADRFRIRWPGDPRPADLPENDSAWIEFEGMR